MKDRILLIGPQLDFLGGVANYYKNILPDLLHNDNVEVKYIQIGSEARQYLKLLTPILDQFKVLYIIIRYRPKLIHVNPSLALKSILRDSLFVFLGKLFRLKTVVFFRGWNKDNQSFFSDSKIKFFTNVLLSADQFLVLNKTVEQFLISKKVSPKKILSASTVIPTQYADLKISNTRVPPSDKLKILFLGRVEKAKGLNELIQALKKFHTKVTLTIVGDGSIWNDLNQIIANDIILKEMITLEKSKVGDDKLNCYLTHDVFILPSYSEGMPNSILEAMSLGLVVIGTSVGAIPDLLSKYGGIVIEPKSVAQIEQGVEYLIDNHARLYKLAQESIPLVKNTYSPLVTAQFLIDVYNNLIYGDEYV
ncbi:polysaccharide biosynthesis protein [Sulfurovum sp. TSL6]|uniref:glycosyltransferase family 4 protein n=1 Tax=Sulfurovum sp. TSL6 TaxID=2826995 RepID=UPI001CC71E3A|nr:glycosyltransferase family 4 protein [Sulfurovum sp. TSL6]GIU00528.1 polysaccharide biosynthesis protein [Sulfurovum sp. TSL6]